MTLNEMIDKQFEFGHKGQFKKAREIGKKIESICPDDLRYNFNKGWYVLADGNFQEGYQLLDSGRFLNVYGNPRLPTDKPIWNNHSIKNKTVILNLEGGLGDEIIHVRFAKDIKERGGKCIVICSKSLDSIFMRVEGVTKCIRLSQLPYTKHDYWIPSFSAGWLFGYDFDNLRNNPYITAEKENVKNWKKIINSDKFKIGIRWSGNPNFSAEQYRKFPSELLINLSKEKNVQMYSLQRAFGIT
jgi:hypothetical protein